MHATGYFVKLFQLHTGVVISLSFGILTALRKLGKWYVFFQVLFFTYLSVKYLFLTIVPFSCFYCFDKPPPVNVWTLNPRLHSSPFYVSIVFISLTPAIPTVFILTYLSTRSIVHAIPLIATWRSAVVIGLEICEYKSHYPDVAQTSLSVWY